MQEWKGIHELTEFVDALVFEAGRSLTEGAVMADLSRSIAVFANTTHQRYWCPRVECSYVLRL